MDTLAPFHLSMTVMGAGYAATSVEGLKRRKYESLGNSYILKPFGVETLGPWDLSAGDYIPDCRQFREVDGLCGAAVNT